MDYNLSHEDRIEIMYRLRSELETRNIEPELWNIVCVLDHLCILRSPDNIRAAVASGELTEEQGKEVLDSVLDVVIH